MGVIQSCSYPTKDSLFSADCMRQKVLPQTTLINYLQQTLRLVMGV